MTRYEELEQESRAERERNDRLLTEARREMIVLETQVQMYYDRFVADPENIAVFQKKAWHEHDARRVSLAEDGSVVAPAGWPPGIDGRRYILDKLGAL